MRIYLRLLLRSGCFLRQTFKVFHHSINSVSGVTFSISFPRYVHSSRPSTMSIRVFEGKEHTELYAKFRPTYPPCVYKTIIDYYRQGKGPSCNFELAVDVGCGSGQATVPLCDHFSHVIGYDVSEQQVLSAPKDIENLSFRVGPGEDLSFLQNDSVDLVTIAQALHWLDTEVFYREVTRVLKPGGVLVAYGYGHNVLDDEEAHGLMTEFYEDLTGAYWNPRRRHIEENYRSIKHPFRDSERIENDEISIKRSLPVDDYVGYLSSWSGWQAYLKQHPGSDALETLRQRFKEIYSRKCADKPVMNIYWPGFMLIGRKPL